MNEYIVIGLLLLIAYILGRVRSYRKARKQCLDCGSYKTYRVSWASGLGGGKANCAVDYWEFYECKKCSGHFSAIYKPVN